MGVELHVRLKNGTYYHAYQEYSIVNTKANYVGSYIVDSDKIKDILSRVEVVRLYGTAGIRIPKDKLQRVMSGNLRIYINVRYVGVYSEDGCVVIVPMGKTVEDSSIRDNSTIIRDIIIDYTKSYNSYVGYYIEDDGSIHIE